MCRPPWKRFNHNNTTRWVQASNVAVMSWRNSLRRRHKCWCRYGKLPNERWPLYAHLYPMNSKCLWSEWAIPRRAIETFMCGIVVVTTDRSNGSKLDWEPVVFLAPSARTRISSTQHGALQFLAVEITQVVRTARLTWIVLPSRFARWFLC